MSEIQTVQLVEHNLLSEPVRFISATVRVEQMVLLVQMD
jgi:hypothetical protein